MSDELAQQSLNGSFDSSKRLNVLIDQIKTNAELNDRYLDILVKQT